MKEHFQIQIVRHLFTLSMYIIMARIAFSMWIQNMHSVTLEFRIQSTLSYVNKSLTIQLQNKPLSNCLHFTLHNKYIWPIYYNLKVAFQYKCDVTEHIFQNEVFGVIYFFRCDVGHLLNYTTFMNIIGSRLFLSYKKIAAESLKCWDNTTKKYDNKDAYQITLNQYCSNVVGSNVSFVNEWL